MKTPKIAFSFILLLALAACGSDKSNSGPNRWASFPVPLYVSSNFIGDGSNAVAAPVNNSSDGSGNSDGSSDDSSSVNLLHNSTIRSSFATSSNTAAAVAMDDSANDSSATALDDLQYAMQFWENKVGKTLFTLQGQWTGAAVPVTGTLTNPGDILGNVVFFPTSWPFGTSNGQDIDAITDVAYTNGSNTNAIIMLNINRPFCHGDCTGSYGDSERRVLAHELGHFLGLQHINDTSNIMNPVIQPGADLSAVSVDMATLQSLTN